MPKIVILYRRTDSQAVVGRIFDRLVSHYGNDSVFIDFDSIPVGVDFREHLRRNLEQADVLLAVIGPRWLGADSAGRARIREEHDPIRIEIETALRADTPLIPILVAGLKAQ